VLDLEKAKDAQAKEIAGLKKRVESSEDKESLGAQEDASKQERIKIVNKTQGRLDDAEMFDTDDLHGDVVIVDMAVGEKQEKSVKNDEIEVSTGVEDSVALTIERAPSFATMLAGIPKNPSYISPDPAMVLGDECVVNRELDNCVMGEVKDFASINNLYVLLSNEGFQELKLVYLGSLWVMIELSSSKAKSGFMKHVGIASWFRQLRNAQVDFVSRERIVWVDIEGVPLHVWSRATFSKIGSRWGELIDLEESSDDSFARKRISIKTSREVN
ncbi:RNA-directed DNA polymerase, eukaryota, partial [Tanacetum coccineum]